MEGLTNVRDLRLQLPFFVEEWRTVFVMSFLTLFLAFSSGLATEFRSWQWWRLGKSEDPFLWVFYSKEGSLPQKLFFDWVQLDLLVLKHLFNDKRLGRHSARSSSQSLNSIESRNHQSITPFLGSNPAASSLGCIASFAWWLFLNYFPLAFPDGF